jgi:hypothetical protein
LEKAANIELGSGIPPTINNKQVYSRILVPPGLTTLRELIDGGFLFETKGVYQVFLILCIDETSYEVDPIPIKQEVKKGGKGPNKRTKVKVELVLPSSKRQKIKQESKENSSEQELPSIEEVGRRGLVTKNTRSGNSYE